MPRPTSFDRVCCPRAMMACHARRGSTMCAVQRRCCHATPDIVRPSVLPKGGEVMPRLMSFDCVQSKGSDVMPHPTSSDHVCCPRAMMPCHAQRCSTMFAVQGRGWHATLDAVQLSMLPKGDDCMPRLTLFNRVCSPRAVISCNARCCRACVLSKGGDVIMPRPTLPTVCTLQRR